MVRIYFVQQWFDLSDPAAEDAIYDRESIRRFVGVELGEDSGRYRSTSKRFESRLPRWVTVSPSSSPGERVELVGLTPLEVIKSATSVGAAVLGVEDQFRSIGEGMVADLVIYGSDPTLDITRARNPAYVIKGGQVVRSPPGR